AELILVIICRLLISFTGIAFKSAICPYCVSSVRLKKPERRGFWSPISARDTFTSSTRASSRVILTTSRTPSRNFCSNASSISG
ncbi:hypothetical protein FJR05_07695, partial [Dolichospermum sp. UHCC 0259]|nr:hypothetical protein [Dolichospermum sp. UHCC 0259]